MTSEAYQKCPLRNRHFKDHIEKIHRHPIDALALAESSNGVTETDLIATLQDLALIAEKQILQL